MKRTVLEINLPSPKLNLFLTYPDLGKTTRKKQISELIPLVNKSKIPTILMGDLNIFKGEKEIKQLLKETHMKHKFKLKKNGRIYTFPTCHPNRRFNYILTSKDIKVKAYRALNLPFSDHLPILIDFAIKK